MLRLHNVLGLIAPLKSILYYLDRTFTIERHRCNEKIGKNNTSEISHRAPIRQGCVNPVRTTKDSMLNHVEPDIIVRVENMLRDLIIK